MDENKDRMKEFWKWAGRIGVLCSTAPYFGTAAAVIGSGLMAVWMSLYDMPAPVIVILAVAAFTGLIWGWNGLAWRHLHLRGTIGASSPSAGSSQQVDRGCPNAIGEAALPKQDSDEVEVLLGRWNVVIIHHESTRGMWTFAADHKMLKTDGTVCGTWAMTPTEVLITWDSYQAPPNASEHCWETLTRPLDPFGVTGKSWRPDAEVRANKIGALAPVLREDQLASPADHDFFVGRWCLGVNSTVPDTFIAELRPDHSARRINTDIVPAADGAWEYANGGARIRWGDGWTDTLRVTKIAQELDGPETTASAIKLAN